MAAGGEENLFGTDGLFGAVVEDDFNFVLVKEVSAAVEVFYVVFFKVPFVDAIQAFHIVISFVLESFEVKRGRFFDIEAI